MDEHKFNQPLIHRSPQQWISLFANTKDFNSDVGDPRVKNSVENGNENIEIKGYSDPLIREVNQLVGFDAQKT